MTYASPKSPRARRASRARLTLVPDLEPASVEPASVEPVSSEPAPSEPSEIDLLALERAATQARIDLGMAPWTPDRLKGGGGATFAAASSTMVGTPPAKTKDAANYQNKDTARIVALKPGEPVVRLFFHNGAAHWCKGYRIYTPRVGANGKPLKSNVDATGGKRLVVREGASVPRPVAIRHEDLKPLDPKENYPTFSDVFGDYAGWLKRKENAICT